jgi:hypothetical protein
MKPVLLSLCALFVSSPLVAQTTPAPTGADLPPIVQPSAISGMPSSARHCVYGDAANVHGIGWVDAGTAYAITFEAESPVVTALSRLDLDLGESTGAVGSPDFQSTASTPGSIALFVGATGNGGCYRYKVELTPPAGAAGFTPASRLAAAPVLAKSTKIAGPTAISGLASSAKHCVSGTYVANVHDIGRVEEGNQITITFESDFDPIAGATMQNLSTRRGTYLIDDDTGGDLEPQLSFTASHSSTLALHVAGYDGSAGCYRYKVVIR